MGIIFSNRQAYLLAIANGTSKLTYRLGDRANQDLRCSRSLHRRETMKKLFFAAIAAVILGLGGTTMANAATNTSPWAHYVNQDNGQG